MIHVSNLTKYYGDYAAVRDVSFDVPTGQIVGFLGPNGAGKTTTMRILAGYLTATSGQATIDGIDVFWDPVEVRRRIGYMPENCPLYPEMRVGEYLHFRGRHQGPARRDAPQAASTTSSSRCWLDDVRRQLIGTLSKGYRQRVGLADALLADPPVLILDEPTAGLDPTQIRETRKLIRELGQEHTHPALDAHPARGGDDLRPGHHHPPRPGRRVRHARRPGAAGRRAAGRSTSSSTARSTTRRCAARRTSSHVEAATAGGGRTCACTRRRWTSSCRELSQDGRRPRLGAPRDQAPQADARRPVRPDHQTRGQRSVARSR